MESWICCRCGVINELTDICRYCEHERCPDCDDEIDEDDIDFFDVIIPP